MAHKVLIWTLISTVCALILKLVSVAIIGGRRKRERAVGFFHPYTNDGGGGERVLWCAVKAVQEDRPDLHCAVFTGDHDASPESLMARALDRFGVKLLYPPKVLSLSLNRMFTDAFLHVYTNLCRFTCNSTYMCVHICILILHFA